MSVPCVLYCFFYQPWWILGPASVSSKPTQLEDLKNLKGEEGEEDFGPMMDKAWPAMPTVMSCG